MHCPHCHYDVRGLSDVVCPECGFPFTISQLLQNSGRDSTTKVVLQHLSAFAQQHPMLSRSILVIVVIVIVAALASPKMAY